MVQRVDEDQLTNLRSSYSEAPVNVGTTHTRFLSQLHARGWAASPSEEDAAPPSTCDKTVRLRKEHVDVDELGIFNDSQLHINGPRPSRIQQPSEATDAAHSKGAVKVRAVPLVVRTWYAAPPCSQLCEPSLAGRLSRRTHVRHRPRRAVAAHVARTDVNPHTLRLAAPSLHIYTAPVCVSRWSYVSRSQLQPCTVHDRRST